MTDNNTNNEKDIKWEDYVRNEVNALLDIYLPFCKTGTVGIKYEHPVNYQLEDGTKVFKDHLCSGVTLNLVFEFDKELKILGTDIEEV